MQNNTKKKIKLANAPCSWGVIEGTTGSTITYSKVLDEMSEAGFEGTELGEWGFMPTDASTLKEELERRELKLAGSWVDINPVDSHYLTEDTKKAVKVARLLKNTAADNNPNLVLGAKRPAYRVSKAGKIKHRDGLNAQKWITYAKNIDFIAQRVYEESGLSCVYHPHGGTWVETPEETATLINLTNPEFVGLCIDTGHCHFGGGDAIKHIQFYQERIKHVHFKDFDSAVGAKIKKYNWDYETAVAQGVFCRLGTGGVDFTGIIKSLIDVLYTGWIVVEQDIAPGASGAKKNAVHNHKYISNLIQEYINIG